VEIGAGNGVNFAHYPPSVEEVVAIEPEPYLRAKAQRAAKARRFASPSGQALQRSSISLTRASMRVWRRWCCAASLTRQAC
jgi:hypothetical protein